MINTSFIIHEIYSNILLETNYGHKTSISNKNLVNTNIHINFCNNMKGGSL